MKDTGENRPRKNGRPARADTPRHPIRVVATRTGLSPSVLRAWERRYGLIDPARSEGGQRLYTDRDIDRLALIKRVTDAGRSIGDVAKLSEAEIRRLAEEDEEARRARASVERIAEDEARPVVRGLRARCLAAVRALDSETLEGTLRRGAATLGGIEFMEQVAAPLLRVVGDEWAEGSLGPGHEHMATAVMRRVLAWLADPASDPSGPAIVIATLSGEQHELGAMLAATAATLEGWAVTFLGPDLPARDIADAVPRVGARVVGLSLANRSALASAKTGLRALRAQLDDDVHLVLGGELAGEAVGDAGLPGTVVVRSLSELQGVLRDLRGS